MFYDWPYYLTTFVFLATVVLLVRGSNGIPAPETEPGETSTDGRTVGRA